MKPAVKAATVAAALSIIGAWAHLQVRSKRRVVLIHATSSSSKGPMSVCPPQSIPDDDDCVPIPESSGKRQKPPRERKHLTQIGSQETIPLRPDRPASFDHYALPVSITGPKDAAVHPSFLGNAAPIHATAFRIDCPGGSPVRTLKLDGQRGNAEVTYVGDLQGPTVVTLHSVQEVGKSRSYLVLLTNVKPIVGLERGTKLAPNQPLGHVARQGSIVLQIRQVRDWATFDQLRGSELSKISVSIPCDPRNVLPQLKTTEEPSNAGVH